MLKGSDFYEKDGALWYHITRGKGGKPREVRLYGSAEELNLCKHIIEMAGDGPVFPKTLKGLDVHYYRAVYASRVYHAYARDLDSIPSKERYVCRGDKKGDIYDRKALKEVRAGVEYHSSHKIRFCVASILFTHGVPVTTLQKYLGHTTIQMTMHYLRNVSDDETVTDIIENALV